MRRSREHELDFNRIDRILNANVLTYIAKDNTNYKSFMADDGQIMNTRFYKPVSEACQLARFDVTQQGQIARIKPVSNVFSRQKQRDITNIMSKEYRLC